MKKLFYSIILIGGFVFYTLIQSKLGAVFSFASDDEGVVTPPNDVQLANSPNTTPQTTPATQTPATTLPATPTSTSTTTTPKPTGQYKDGSYTGSAADAFYGTIQVKAIISGGKITDVIFLQYPNDRSNSVRINTQAMPYLKAEAIQVQSANVNTISGASYSSQAFRESLASALTQAKI